MRIEEYMRTVHLCNESKSVGNIYHYNRINSEKIFLLIRHQLDKAVSNASSTAERNKLKKQLNQPYIDEKKKLKQKSRNYWLREGDRNTKYFQTITKTRNSKNRITSILD